MSCVLGDFVNARTRENQSKGANSRVGSRGTLPKKLPEAATMDNDVDFIDVTITMSVWTDKSIKPTSLYLLLLKNLFFFLKM